MARGGLIEFVQDAPEPFIIMMAVILEIFRMEYIKMTLEEIRKNIIEIYERYGIQFSEIQEKRENGQIKTIYLTLKFRVDSPKIDPIKKGIDKK